MFIFILFVYIFAIDVGQRHFKKNVYISSGNKYYPGQNITNEWEPSQWAQVEFICLLFKDKSVPANFVKVHMLYYYETINLNISFGVRTTKYMSLHK